MNTKICTCSILNSSIEVVNNCKKKLFFLYQNETTDIRIELAGQQEEQHLSFQLKQQCVNFFNKD